MSIKSYEGLSTPDYPQPEILQDIFDEAVAQNIDLRVTGSIGRLAVMEGAVDWRRSDGTMRDIDMKVIPDNNNQIRIPTGYEEISSFDDKDNFVLDFSDLRTIERHGDDYYLRYRDVRVPVDGRVFDPFEARVDDIPIVTLDPRTLFHMNHLSIGQRSKDIANLRAFRGAVMEKSELPEEMFQPFHELKRLRREKYTNDIRFKRLAATLKDHLPNPLYEHARSVGRKIARPALRHAGVRVVHGPFLQER